MLSEWAAPSVDVLAPLRDVLPYGRTPLFDAVAEAVPMLQEGTHRKKALVVLSDGHNTLARHSPNAVVDLVQRSETLIYAIAADTGPRVSGLGPNLERTDPTRANLSNLRRLTDRTGGRTLPVRRLQDLAPAARQIADELRSQYLIGFEPVASPSGRALRRVDVKLIKGFELMNQMPYPEARKRVEHPVACIDCHRCVDDGASRHEAGVPGRHQEGEGRGRHRRRATPGAQTATK